MHKRGTRCATWIRVSTDFITSLRSSLHPAFFAGFLEALWLECTYYYNAPNLKWWRRKEVAKSFWCTIAAQCSPYKLSSHFLMGWLYRMPNEAWEIVGTPTAWSQTLSSYWRCFLTVAPLTNSGNRSQVYNPKGLSSFLLPRRIYKTEMQQPHTAASLTRRSRLLDEEGDTVWDLFENYHQLRCQLPPQLESSTLVLAFVYTTQIHYGFCRFTAAPTQTWRILIMIHLKVGYFQVPFKRH